MIVLLDNRDSFVFNLARCFHLLGVPVVVVPAHASSVADVERHAPRAVVISPGPCTPAEAGCSLATVAACRGRIPVFGVCLGHQVIAAACGGRVVRAREPVHGRTSRIHHDGVDLFAGLPPAFPAARYHSLVVEDDTLPPPLVVTARDEQGTVMAVCDPRAGLYGVQFHPESILTRGGFRILGNFLSRAGIPHLERLIDPLDADVARQAGDDADRAAPENDRVVTF